eukprot:4337733-Lingulodinium_polyedra.AAC.1
MGLPADFQDLVAVEWRLLWSGDTLYVSDRVAAEPDIVEDITNCFLSVLCTQAWSDSRWLTVGRSCRNLCVAQMLGLAGLVQFILDKKLGQYQLNGWSKLAEGDNKDFVTCCALAAYIPDSVLELMLDDSRAAKHCDVWQDTAVEEA